MSFMPPEVPDFPPDDMAPNGQPPEEPEESVDETVDACLRAIKVAAEDAATSDDPAAFKEFGQGAFYFAQSVEKLLPQKPSPDTQLKVEADAVKAGAQQAHEEAQGEKQRAHDLELKKLDVAKQQKVRVDRSDGTSSTYTKEG